MEPLQLGVSNYVPANAETDLFRLDTWTEGDKETESGHPEPGLQTDSGHAEPGLQTDSGQAQPGLQTDSGNAQPGLQSDFKIIK